MSGQARPITQICDVTSMGVHRTKKMGCGWYSCLPSNHEAIACLHTQPVVISIKLSGTKNPPSESSVPLQSHSPAPALDHPNNVQYKLVLHPVYNLHQGARLGIRPISKLQFYLCHARIRSGRKHISTGLWLALYLASTMSANVFRS